MDRNFCCFVIETLNCEISKLARFYPNEANIVENGTKFELNECFETYGQDKSFCQEKNSSFGKVTIIWIITAAILLILFIGGIYFQYKFRFNMNFLKKNVSMNNRDGIDLSSNYESILPINRIQYDGPKDKKLQSLFNELKTWERKRLSMKNSMDKLQTGKGEINELFPVNGKIDALEQRIIYKTLMLKYPEEFQTFKNADLDDLKKKYYELKNNCKNYKTYRANTDEKEKIYNKSELVELSTLARETLTRKKLKPDRVDDDDYDDPIPTINLQLSELKLKTYQNKLNSIDKWYHKITDKLLSPDEYEKQEYLRSLLRQRIRYSEELLKKVANLKSQVDLHKFIEEQIELLKKDIARRDKELSQPLFPKEKPRYKLEPNELARLEYIQEQERKWRAKERSKMKDPKKIAKSLEEEAVSDRLNELLIDGLKYREYRHPSLYPDDRWRTD